MSEYKTLKTRSGEEIKVDAEDYAFLSRYTWYLCDGYAMASVFVSRKWMYLAMHKLLMGYKNEQIDHINRERLDNRKSNLRKCTIAQNSSNRVAPKKSMTGYRGVKPSGKRYVAQINHQGKKHFFGPFVTTLEAAKAYDQAAKRFHGEFAILNFPDRKAA